MKRLLVRIKDWYLGGDPNDDSHKALKVVGMGPFPLPGERGRMQRAVRRAMERK